MSDIIGARAAIPNPSLAPLAFLIGTWRTGVSHPMFPGETFDGSVRFEWHHGGAFLIMRSDVDHPKFPDGLAIFGSDDAAGRISMIYFDERGTSRIYEVTAGDRTITWRREDPEFAQIMTISASGAGLVAKGRMSIDGGEWTDDLSQTCERIENRDTQAIR